MINADGILVVKAKELRSGVEQSIEVKPQYGISDIDVEKMLNEKLDKVIEKYPKELFNKNTVSENPGTEDIYWKVKEDYRREKKN